MKFHRGNTSGLALAAVLVAALAFWLNGERLSRAAEASGVLVAAESSVIAKKIRAVEQRIFVAERSRSEAEAELAAIGGVGGLTATKTSGRAPILSQSQWMADKPALQVLELQRQRAAIHQEYGDYFRAEEWSRERIERFMEIELGHIEHDMDLRDVARSPDPALKETVAALRTKSETDYEAARVELLGLDGHRQLQGYLNRTVPLQNVLVRGLAGAAALQGVPLTAEQGTRLERAAAESAPAGPVTHHLLKTVDWSEFEHRAREILSPAQFEIFSTQAPPVGFSSWAALRSEAAMERARKIDAEKSPPP